MTNLNAAAISVEPGTPADIPSFRQLFSDVVLHSGEYYSNLQLQAWVTAATNDAYWSTILNTNHFLKAILNNQLTGFASYTFQGEVDHLYVLPQLQQHGIGTMLLKQIELQAKAQQIRLLKTDASLFSRNLFRKMGFQTLQVYEKSFAGARFINTRMEKVL